MVKKSEKGKIDRIFLITFFILVVFGLIVLSSASSSIGYVQFSDAYYFIKKQILFGLLPGLALFFICLKIKYDFWQKNSWIIYVASLILLVLVFVSGIGLVINGARSWISFMGHSFQPAEFAKLSLIIMLAALLSDGKRDINDFSHGLLPILLLILPCIVLIGLQPDIGTLSIIAVIIFVMLYLADVKKVHLMFLGMLGVAAFAVILIIAPYRIQRLTTFLHPELDPKGVGYQINQSFLAVGSGGLLGMGFGHSRQKFEYLPEVHADSIFAIIAEELGFIISSFLVVLIAFFGLRGLRIAKAAPSKFSRLLVGGIMVWFIWQSFLNIGSMIGVLPLTGVPLPLISHGGSALMISFAAVGIILNISREARL